MWYEVHNLNNDGLNKSQISRQTDLDRATVRKYLQMNEDEFHQWISKPRQMPLKLSKYIKFVRQDLEGCPALSAAQVEDHLKEHYDDFPTIHSKTIYNLVKTVREKYSIPKPKINQVRVFEKIPETAYGQQAQVDFGQTWMQTKTGKRKKVFFFAMVLSRSRFKHVFFSDKPFTSSKANDAHEAAFEYFKGVPKEILYDQDAVFIHNENLGDYLLTDTFGAYCKTQDFKAVFCRKADPQTKGKVENVVKYVKQNFLRGRKYINIDILQQEAVAWLERTANVKIHSSTQKNPTEEWKKEQEYLFPIKNKTKEQTERKKEYKVRKDNTIVYKSNFYSLPAGTYKNAQSSIFLEIKENKLYLYSSENELITKHQLNIGRGEYIRNTDHQRQKSGTTETMLSEVLKMLGNSKTVENYFINLKRKKSRYYRDNLQEILKQKPDYQKEIVEESVIYCIENNHYNAFVLLKIMASKQNEKEQTEEAEKTVKNILQTQTAVPETDIEVQKSNINDYEKIF